MRSSASFTRPASATQYTAGDHIGNSATGSSVTPMTFKMGVPRGALLSAKCVVTPASGNLVITALDFELLLFRPNTDIPFAAGSYPADNAALTLTSSAYGDFVGSFKFNNYDWRNPLGAKAAGATGSQIVTPVNRAVAMFHTLDTDYLVGVVQVLDAWNPGNVANTFAFTLESTFE